MTAIKAIHRPRHTLAQRRELIAQYRQCRATLPEFAQQHGLELSTLCHWLLRADKTPGSTRLLFQEVLLPAPSLAPAWAVEIAVGADLTLRLGSQSSPEFIAKIIHHLRQP